MARPSDAVDPVAGPITTAAHDERPRTLGGGRLLLLLFWLALLATPLASPNDYIVSLGASRSRSVMPGFMVSALTRPGFFPPNWGSLRGPGSRSPAL